MIIDKIQVFFRKKADRKQTEVIKLKWQKAELERQLKFLKENSSK